MQGGGLEDTDEHEGKAKPSAKDLDHPSLPLRGKESVILSGAIADVPENVAARKL